MKFIAYTVKGLEQVVINEISRVIKNSIVESFGDKFVVFQAEPSNINISDLRTVDDTGILVLEIVKPKKLTFKELVGKIEDINFTIYLERLKSFRELNNNFSITLSISGLRINKIEFERSLSSYIRDKYNLEYTPKDHSNFDIRVFLNRKFGFISIRLTKDPMYKRGYKEYSSMGSLKPTVAATMIKILTDDFSGKLIDNFCGSGSILAEAKILGFEVFGGDIKQENVLNSQKNLANLGINKAKNNEIPRSDLRGIIVIPAKAGIQTGSPINSGMTRQVAGSYTIKNIKLLDATNTKWESNYFDYAVSNLPWDKQVGVVSITELYIKTLEEYKRIVKVNGSLCLLVHKPQILIKYAKKYFPNHKIESTKVSFTGQSPTIVTIKSNNSIWPTKT